MTPPLPRDVLLKIRKLASLPEEVRQSEWAVSITRLTVLKSLCRDPEVANRFVVYLALKTFENLKLRQERSPTDASYMMLMEKALEGMEAWQRTPTEKLRHTLTGLLGLMRAEQNEYRDIAWGQVRLITDSKLLFFEYVLSCLLASATEVGSWAYQTARHYAERYEPSRGTGLISASVPLVQDIADFWVKESGLTPESLTQPKASKVATVNPSPSKTGKAPMGRSTVKFTPRQGQFLAFIHLYRKMHRQGSAETDLVKFFRVTPPTVHGMVVRLEELGLITREPGVGRSMLVAIPAEQLPELEDVAGPAW